jgi:hypothetical protein
MAPGTPLRGVGVGILAGHFARRKVLEERGVSAIARVVDDEMVI